MTQTYKYIGKGRPLVEGREKVTGTARYVADLKLPDMLYGRPVLSPHAHANILSVDKSMAEAIPGVVAILLAEDLPTKDQAMTSRYSAVLAKEKVLFVGQPVAIVVAETPAAATDAAELVFVEYDPLPAVVHLQEALQPDAPTLWPQGPPTEESSRNLHMTIEEEQQRIETQLNNVSFSSHYQRGDIATGFAESDVIIEQTYHLDNVHQSYMEPHTCIAVPDPVDNGLTIYTSTQGKFLVRDEVAELLSLPPRQVRIEPMTIGGGFGAKYGILEPLAGAVALTVQRPVQIVLSRSEDFVTTTPAPAITIELKTGAKQDGMMTALQARVLVDNGLFNFKYGSYGEAVTALLSGMYKFPHVNIDNYEVNTNKAPIGAYRAPGGPPAIFALESNIDDMAAALGLDLLEFRLQNVTDTGDMTSSERTWPPGFKTCLERLKGHPAWQTRQTNAGEGVGLALGGWPTGVGTAEAICRVDTDGSASLEVGHVDVTGNDSSFILIAAEALGLSPDDVTVVHGDTTGGPYGPMSGGSQVTYSTAGAVDVAVQQAKVKLLQVAADQFEAAPEDIELVDGQARVKGVPDRFITIAELAQIARSQSGGPGPIFGAGQAAIEENAPVVSVHLVKVNVDPETGQVKPLQYLLVQDVGFAINPLLVEGQLHGGMVQGLGIGLHEAMVYDETGQLLSGSFLDYGLPHIDDVPHLEAVLVENPSPYGPFGARGVGEPPILGGAAAVANAIKDATGIRVTTAPIRAEMLWDHMRNSTESS